MKGEVLGIPFDRCGSVPGSALGPEAIRLAIDRIEPKEFRDTVLSAIASFEITAPPPQCEVGDSLRAFSSAMGAFQLARRVIGETLSAEGRFPVMLGGDHSLAIGSVAAAHDAVRKIDGGRLAVLWIDAHADINSPATSPSGNLHGMPLGALIGRDQNLQHPEWQKLQTWIGDARLDPAQVAWIGLRDVDPGESSYLADLKGCFATTMQDIDHHGLSQVVEAFEGWLRAHAATHLWISFDVDALDPVLAPGTGTAVRGGLTYREAHFLAELLHELHSPQSSPVKLLGLDVVEVNPLIDVNNTTARVAIEWIASLFGKRILPRRPPIAGLDPTVRTGERA